MKIPFLFILLSTFVLLFAQNGGVTEQRLRLAGLVLQLLGIFAAMCAVGSLRSLATGLRDWLRDSPLGQGQAASGTMNATLPHFTLEAHGYETICITPSASTEERVRILERGFALLSTRLDHRERYLSDALHALGNLLKKEEWMRTREDSMLAEMIKMEESARTRTLPISMMSLLWLLVGTVLATTAQEIAGLFR